MTIFEGFQCKEIENIIRLCNDDQKEQIRLGFRHGLSVEQIKLYALPIYRAEQMQEIRIGLEKGLKLEQIKTYADPRFYASQMEEIRLGYEHGLSKEQVEIYAKLEFYYLQMREIRLGLENGLSIDKVKIYANKKFDSYQMKEIRLGLQNGLSKKQIKIYANPKFSSLLMFSIRSGLECGLSIEQVKTYAKNDIDVDIALYAKDDLIKGYDIEKVRLYLQQGINKKQANCIREGFDHLRVEDIKIYAKPEIKSDLMQLIKDMLIHGYDRDTVKRIAELMSKENVQNLINWNVIEFIEWIIRNKIPLELLNVVLEKFNNNLLTRSDFYTKRRGIEEMYVLGFGLDVITKYIENENVLNEIKEIKNETIKSFAEGYKFNNNSIKIDI